MLSQYLAHYYAERNHQVLDNELIFPEPDERLLELVRRVGYDLALRPTDDYFAYEFYMIHDPSPNAFAMPNGKIYVHTGMLARLEDSSQLAAPAAGGRRRATGHAPPGRDTL